MKLAAFCFCLLGLTFLSHGWGDQPWAADPEFVEKKMAKSGGFNYREADVPEYQLPEILKNEAGEVVTAGDWPARRSELMELFREHVYGRRPDVPYEVRFDVVHEQKGIWDGAANAREVKVRILAGGSEYSYTLLVFVPILEGDKAAKPLPTIIHLNNRDFPDFEKAIAEPDDFWPVRMICEQGFVAAAVSTKQIDPDAKNRFDDGIRGFLAKASGQKPTPSSWGALSSWGWGVSRAIDYLLTMPEVDKTRIAMVGHSRGGKAALWAAAEDPRIAIAYSNNSGCGGAALSRRQFGETVDRITTSFPYWFCGRFRQYANQEAKLPVDQHQLVALVAPRAVYITSATEDLWADPHGEYLSLIEAAPAFELLGEESIVQPTMPAADKQRIVGKTGYHIRTGGHGLTPFDWQQFMQFVKAQ
ncbi:hypothetical protein FF011L_18640 [Roseimaritima multifibrata]|uniref:4-O-methyl-glucuronoyl methylesterase-like domain-containing protein n=1 Tax=Roseimaritima multifibrata TaxID=1930274 RepID=A0A517MDZ7_9BACT|nr:acyl-CoA thioester hydrolase/BAAT C-terminal domain-containing protein [Roseimaritima multifibrata]QDS93109.1 hypothetical protein FF011L_18640 [Roseimaritima multifibrata]